MPKWLSHWATPADYQPGAGPEGWHLYPDSAVERNPPQSEYDDRDDIGAARGYTYCGKPGGGEQVAPLLETMFDSLKEYAEAPLGEHPRAAHYACDVCAQLARKGRLADPEWRREYDAEYGERTEA